MCSFFRRSYCPPTSLVLPPSSDPDLGSHNRPFSPLCIFLITLRRSKDATAHGFSGEGIRCTVGDFALLYILGLSGR